MALLSKLAKEAIRAAEADHIPQLGGSRWAQIADNLIIGNERLADKIDSVQSVADDPLAARILSGGRQERNFEWGGTATGHSVDEPYTSFSPNTVTPRPVDRARGGVFFHTHPTQVSAKSGAKVGSWLSSSDLDWAVFNDMGITSLDREGGLGMALVNPKATPEMARARALQATLTNEVMLPHITEAGSPGELRAIASGYANHTYPSESLAAQRGIGLALKDANILTHYSYTPGPMRQVGERTMAPMVEASRKLAEMFIRPYLEARGFKDGKIDLIIAAAVASGSVGSLLAHLQREEATKSEIA